MMMLMMLICFSQHAVVKVMDNGTRFEDHDSVKAPVMSRVEVVVCLLPKTH
jgi:hypothetical protein